MSTCLLEAGRVLLSIIKKALDIKPYINPHYTNTRSIVHVSLHGTPNANEAAGFFKSSTRRNPGLICEPLDFEAGALTSGNNFRISRLTENG